MRIQFRKSIKAFFSNKAKSSEKISFAESDKTFTKEAKNAENLNTFFTNAVKNLKIPECEEVLCLAEKRSHPILEAIFKYSKHKIIIAANNVSNQWRIYNISHKLLRPSQFLEKCIEIPEWSTLQR